MKGASRTHSGKVGRRLNLSLEPVAGSIIFVLLVLGALARGLFFQPDLLQFQVAVTVVFALQWFDRIVRRDGSVIEGWADALPLLLAVAYGVSFFVAIDRRAAFGEALRYLALFMVYWTVSRLSETRAWAQGFVNLIVFIGVILSGTGLAAAVGLVRFPGAYSRNEILSTIQYSNALAGFLSAVCVIIVAAWGPRPKGRDGATGEQGIPSAPWAAEIWYALAFVLCATVILSTKSRGAWVLLPLAGGLAVLGLPAGLRFQAGVRASTAVVATLAVLRRIEGVIASVAKVAAKQTPDIGVVVVDRPIALKAAASIGLWIGVATLAVLAGVLAARLLSAMLRSSRVPPHLRQVARYVLVLWAAGIAVWYTAYAGSAYPTVARGFLTPSVAAQVESIDPGNPGLVARETLWGDAARIIADHPLTGAGGGGFNALYRMYQKKAYSSALAHSHPLEVGVETGLPGLLIYLGMWTTLIRNAWRLRRRAWFAQLYGEPDDAAERAWLAFWPAASGAIAMALHSSIDFDFSLTAISACAWGLVACANGVFRDAAGRAPGAGSAADTAAKGRVGDLGNGPRLTMRSALGQAALGLLLSALLLVPSMRMLEAGSRGALAAGAMLSGDYVTAEKRYREAINLDPYSSSYWIDLAQLAMASYTIDAQPWRLQQVREYCTNALAVQPSNLATRIRAVELFAMMGDIDHALALAADTVRWVPRDVRVYEGLARVHAAMAIRAAENGDRQTGREHAARARDIIPEAAKALNPDPGPRLPEALLASAETPSMCYAAGQALHLLGDYTGAARLLEKSLRHEAIKGDAGIWLGASYEALGNAAGAKRALDLARSTLGADAFTARYSHVKALGGLLR